MKKINHSRVKRLIESAISDFSLDLKGISVLTEAASGPFVVTPLIAALSGADQVVAITKDSFYGQAVEIKEYTEELAKQLGVNGKIVVTSESPKVFAKKVHLVTNLGFVRPINGEIIRSLPKDSAIALMWEPWEFRWEDLDLKACKERNIPVLGTWEGHPGLQIFRYVGLLALKLLFDCEIEVFKSKILIIGSGVFGDCIKKALISNGAFVMYLNTSNIRENLEKVGIFIKDVDAMVIVEPKEKLCLIGGKSGIPVKWLVDKGISVIHICGVIDEDGLKYHGINKFPDKQITPGHMAITTDYLGPRPVVDLHAAGLKVGGTLVRGMRLFQDATKAVDYALKHSPALNFD